MRHLLFSSRESLNSYIKLPALPVNLPSNSVENGVALITGATGFIGGFLLKELLKNKTFNSCVCLVRGTDKQAALERVKKNLLSKGTPEHLLAEASVSVECGDVLQPQFGLSAETYEGLISSVDHVFHFAATMNWVAPFSNETVANIDALKTAIQFCATDRLKKLHYASSMGMWTLLQHTEGPILEDVIHEQGEELPGGYFQSKWINENILRLAKQAGIPVNVYRIGDVKGDSEWGLGDPQNLGNLAMQYFILSGAAIDCAVPEFNFIPVDFLAKALAHISVNESNQTFQFSNAELISFKDMYEQAVAAGHSIQLLALEEWLKVLRSDGSRHATFLKPVFKMFDPGLGLEKTCIYDIGVEMFRKTHDTRNTDAALQGTEISCPAMLSDGILRKYVTHLGEEVVNS